MKLSTSHCRDCGNKLLGRSDKKFCNDYCRNTYHSKRNRDVNNHMRNINNILRKNRRILHQLIQNNICTCPITDLLHLGFQMEYCTQFYRDHNNKEFKYYYDISLSLTGNEVNIHKSSATRKLTFQSKAG